MSGREDLVPASGAGRIRPFLRATLLWAVASAASTAFLTSFARLLCLPPYWPPDYVLRCRPDDIGLAIGGALGSTGITAIMLFVPALLPGLIAGFAAATTDLRRHRLVWLVASTAAFILWFLIVRRLQVSYLDYIVSLYSIAGGALAGALAIRRSRRREHRA